MHLNHWLLALGERNSSSTGRQFNLTICFKEKKPKQQTNQKQRENKVFQDYSDVYWFGYLLFWVIVGLDILEVKRNPSTEKEANKHRSVIEGEDACGSLSAFCLWTKESSFFVK